jgi:hypothetical protein
VAGGAFGLARGGVQRRRYPAGPALAARAQQPTILERVGGVVEGVARLGVLCGMGHISELNRRMLQFY